MMSTSSRRSVLLLAGAAVLAAGTASVATACGLAGEAPAASSVPSVAPRLRSRWTGRPAGPLPTTGDEGVPLRAVLTDAPVPPSIAPDGLRGNLPDRGAATYLMQPLGAKVRRVGAWVGFGPGSDDGVVALVAFVEGGLAAHGHLVLTPRRWIASISTGTELVEIGSGTLAAPLPQDGTPQRVEVLFDGPRTVVVLPDGSTREVVDARVASTDGTVACWEWYKQAEGAADVVLYETWAG